MNFQEQTYFFPLKRKAYRKQQRCSIGYQCKQEAELLEAVAAVIWL